MVKIKLNTKSKLKLLRQIQYQDLTNQFNIYFDKLYFDKLYFDDVKELYYLLNKTVNYLEKFIKQKHFLTDNIVFNDEKLKSLLTYTFVKEVFNNAKITMDLLNKNVLEKNIFYKSLNMTVELYKPLGYLSLNNFKWLGFKIFNFDSKEPLSEIDKQSLFNLFDSLKEFLVKKPFLELLNGKLIYFLDDNLTVK